MIMYTEMIERFSYDLEIKTREQYRNNKQTEIERFNWFIDQIQTRVAFYWLSKGSGGKNPCPIIFLKSIDTSLDVILQHNVAVGFSLVGIRRVHLLIHWLIKQMTNTYRNHFSKSYKNRSIPLQ